VSESPDGSADDGSSDGSSDFTVVSSTLNFSGRIIQVRTDRLRMPDGSESDREIVAHPGAVAIVALDDEERVVMVRQFRQPVRRFLEELPAGLLDVAGEPALTAAKRELYEEASLRADEWSVLLDLLSSPGMTDEAMRVYLARGLREVGEDERHVGEHEEATMTVRRVPLDEARDAALSGQLVNATTVAGILACVVARADGFAALRPADAFWAARGQLTPAPAPAPAPGAPSA
jgi:8-oxo-dGTP pyrophosphatase MutT (NUDIX family)